MVEGFSHTPYGGSSQPFTIGLTPLDLRDWIEIDATFDVQLAEKRRLQAERPADVFVAEAGTEDAQAEVRDLLVAHLPERFPDRYAAAGSGLSVIGQPPYDPDGMPPLRQASLLVQEDLILMRRGQDGWRLAAGSLCFPSSWSLTEKFGKPLHEIHDPVPGFGADSRPNELISRMFDNLSPGRPVQRFNWSVQSGDALFHPLSNEGRIDRAARLLSKFPEADAAAHAFIRVERQTLRKLPASGDILFTIRIYLDPLARLAQHPESRRIAASFAGQLDALDTAQLDYKGLAPDRDRLVDILRSIAGLP